MDFANRPPGGKACCELDPAAAGVVELPPKMLEDAAGLAAVPKRPPPAGAPVPPKPGLLAPLPLVPGFPNRLGVPPVAPAPEEDAPEVEPNEKVGVLPVAAKRPPAAGAEVDGLEAPEDGGLFPPPKLKDMAIDDVLGL